MGELAHVEFHGDLLDTFVGIDGTPWVSLKRLCENLGLALEAQRRKLKEKPWANLTIMPTTATDGKRYDTTMIDLDTIPGFLFSIDAEKVAPGVKKKIITYQCEAAKVLGDHFREAMAKPAAAVAEVEIVTLPAPPLPTVAPPVPPALPPAPPPRMTLAERLADPAYCDEEPPRYKTGDLRADMSREITILRGLVSRLTNRVRGLEQNDEWQDHTIQQSGYASERAESFAQNCSRNDIHFYNWQMEIVEKIKVIEERLARLTSIAQV
jgi:hypothetical protein